MIGIICAMEEEASIIKKLINNKFEYKIYDMSIIIGKINDKQVTLIISGIGTTNATIATTLLLNQFDIKQVINIGTVGACDQKMNIGDIVIPDSAIYLDVDVRAFDYSYGQVPKMPSVFAFKKHYYNYLKKNISKNINLFQGLLGTSNKFIDNYNTIKKLNRLINNNLLIIDMEGCAIAQTCFLANIDFIAIKIVSDLIVENKNDNNEQFINFIKHDQLFNSEIIVSLINYL